MRRGLQKTEMQHESCVCSLPIGDRPGQIVRAGNSGMGHQDKRGCVFTDQHHKTPSLHFAGPKKHKLLFFRMLPFTWTVSNEYLLLGTVLCPVVVSLHLFQLKKIKMEQEVPMCTERDQNCELVCTGNTWGEE